MGKAYILSVSFFSAKQEVEIEQVRFGVFVSLFFLLFLALLWLVYAIEPVKYRKITLLLFSYGFCGYISVEALVFLVLSTLLVFYGGKAVEACQVGPKGERQTAGKAGGKSGMAKLLAAGIALGFAFVLVVVKNIPYLIKMFGIGWIPEQSGLRTLILPVGFSFYAFQAIGYLYDVYEGKERAEQNFVCFALYMGFFAKLVSGPIERKGRFVEQLAKLETVSGWNGDRIALAANYLLWGYFLKLVVADRLALIVNEIYRVPEAYDSIWLVGGAVFYSFQVYTDFAGYTCIAMGCAYLFGIRLSQNFKNPYKAVNITDFWRRWHMSLSSWLRDYVYIPLGGNRKGTLRKYGNTMVVFVLCGIWHGNGLSFLVWGFLHGFYSIVQNIWGKRIYTRHVVTERSPGQSTGKEGCAGTDCLPGVWGNRLLTFLAVTFAWIFFRAESLTLALNYIRKMLTSGIRPLAPIGVFEQSGILMLQVYLGMALIVLVQIADGICDKKNMDFAEVMQQQSRPLRYLFYYGMILLIFVIGIYGAAFPTETFIYMQF